MKLYEFTFTDNRNLPESEVFAQVADILKEEAQIQGWKPGYTFFQSKEIEHFSSGDLRYTFSVQGEVIEGYSVDNSSDEDVATRSSTNIAACPPETEL